MDENKLLDNEQLENVIGGTRIIEDGKKYSVFQVAYLYVMEAIRCKRIFPEEADRIRANWAEVNEDLLAAGNENVDTEYFIEMVKKAWIEHNLGYWPPV